MGAGKSSLTTPNGVRLKEEGGQRGQAAERVPPVNAILLCFWLVVLFLASSLKFCPFLVLLPRGSSTNNAREAFFPPFVNLIPRPTS